MEALNQYLIEFASLFGYKYDDSFFDYLKSISTPNLTVCGKEIKEGDGGWKCEDCELITNSIFCNECFIKEKHIGHKTYFNPAVTGFCDCGINTTIKPEGFCDKHKGDFKNMNDLMDYIKSSINDKFLNDINNIFNNIFLLFIEKIKNLNDIGYEEKKEENYDDEIYKMIETLEIFGDKLYTNNLSLFYLFTLKFTENFPYEANHQCFYFDENKNLISFIKKDKEIKHTCICPFMQIIIYILMRRNTKQDSFSFFNLFIQTYKNKIVTGLCFLNSYSDLFYNDNLFKFRGMEFQLISEKISILIYKENNIPFFEKCLDNIYLVCENFLKKKEYKKLQEIYFSFYFLLTFLPRRKIIDKMNSNKNILKKFFDIFCLLNNENVFENNLKSNKSQKNNYSKSLSDVELYSLKSIMMLIHIINFDDKEVVNFLFQLIFEKLYAFKKYKETLSDKIFSPYLIIIKCYSIILNRFCFNYSIKNNCDLLDSFNHYLDLFPQAKDLNIFLFKELINYFGFIISQLYSFFNYYSSNMEHYYTNYFRIGLVYFRCDVSLMKYLLSLSEIKEQFNLRNIILLSDIDSSNKLFYDLLNENININDDNFIYNIKENNLKYINSLIEFLYLIIRDNLSMEKIAFWFNDLKMKMIDEIYEKLYKNEKDDINKLVRNDIIHYILGENNLVKRDDCIDYLNTNYNNNYLELLDELLKNDCEKIVLENSLIKFSLKKDILNSCDIDYIMSLEKRTNAIKYITNFQSKNFDASNINIIEPLNLKKKLMKNEYQTFFNEKNIEEIIKLYNLIYINRKKVQKLNDIFYFNLTKILSFAFNICSTNLLDEDFKLKLLEKIKYIKDNLFESKKLQGEKDKKSLKDKLKKKFIKKNELLMEKIIPSNIIIEEDNIQKESCVYCHQKLNKVIDSIDNYGKICYYFSDSITDFLKKLPEEKRNKAKKFISCNHKIHFNCFDDFISIHFENEFECPLCKKLSNIILFDYSCLVENNYDLIKGINFTNDIINIDSFYKKEDNITTELKQYSVYSFENYCLKLLKKQILIKDINDDETLMENIFKLILKDFEEFTMYYSRANNTNGQIEIWRNILYNIRLLFKYKILNISNYISKLIEKILKINNKDIFEELLIENDFCDIINKFIIICFILFDPNEENKEKIKNIFKNNILLYYIYVTFLKSNNDDIEKFLDYNKIELKDALDLFDLKYKICLLLFNEKEGNINFDKSLEEIINSIKTNSDFIYLINSIKKDSYISCIKNQYLRIPEFNIIILPESGIEFLNKTNINCIYCKKKNLSSFLCLLCGNKICDDIKCCIENGSKKGNEYSLIYHSKKCTGGNSIFLNINKGEIVYLLKRRFISTKIFI